MSACVRHRGAFEDTRVTSPPMHTAPPTPLTAAATGHVDSRSLARRDDPLRFPRARGSDAVELALQHRPGFGHSRVAPAGGRGAQRAADRPRQTPGNFSKRHDRAVCHARCGEGEHNVEEPTRRNVAALRHAGGCVCVTGQSEARALAEVVCSVQSGFRVY